MNRQQMRLDGYLRRNRDLVPFLKDILEHPCSTLAESAKRLGYTDDGMTKYGMRFNSPKIRAFTTVYEKDRRCPRCHKARVTVHAYMIRPECEAALREVLADVES